jgi:hypothetical protein
MKEERIKSAQILAPLYGVIVPAVAIADVVRVRVM